MKRAVYIISSYHHNYFEKYDVLAKSLHDKNSKVLMIVYDRAFEAWQKNFKSKFFDVIYSADLNNKSTYKKNIEKVALGDLIRETLLIHKEEIINVDIDRAHYYKMINFEAKFYNKFIDAHLSFFLDLATNPPSCVISEGPNNTFLRALYKLNYVLQLNLNLITHRLGKLPSTYYLGVGQLGTTPILRKNIMVQAIENNFVPDYARVTSKLRRPLRDKFQNITKGDTINTIKYIFKHFKYMEVKSLWNIFYYTILIIVGMFREVYRFIGRKQLNYYGKKPQSSIWIFPEQYHPEASTSMFFRGYENEIKMFRYSSQLINENLYYKSHPSVLGRNGFFWYKDFKKNILDTSFDLSDEKILGCITINSTIILDFLKIGKPVIVFGESELTNMFSEYILKLEYTKGDILCNQKLINDYLKNRICCNNEIVTQTLKFMFHKPREQGSAIISYIEG